ncbi:hypothetical protein G5C51_39305 [Streptomyces sp. A7024]|uniref:Uncharacterized protein n=1 Tax=Streptomyces coryli TaxID=1128680 RepID=A0A6G4UCP9_9ACTN|nr:hypothetical protein [Streptomyces coryli]NGN69923.1 hypothetical protein [Streptomyces coryli]
MPEHHHDELRRKLRSAAGEYEPDSARIRARVERGMAEPGSVDVTPAARHRARAWLRPVGAAVAVAGVLAAAGVSATAALRQDDGPQQPSAATSAPESQSPTSGPTPSESGRRSMPPAPPASSDAASRSPERSSKPSSDTKPPEKAYADGPLWTDGSLNSGSGEYWSQSDVTLKTRRTLTKVTVELRLARTEGLASTGSWRTLPEDDFDTEVEEEDGYLIYRWTLKEGRSIPPGDHVFAGQYDHPEGSRDAGKDDYSATAVAPDDDHLSVEGDFFPRDD